VLQSDEKVTRLLDLLRGIKNDTEESEEEPPRILIFAATKRTGWIKS
jgi:hypothetical protein